MYVPVFWLQDSGGRQFALIRLPFLLWGAFRIQRDLGQGFAMAANRLGYDLARKSARQAVTATYALALVLFHVLIEPRKRAEKPN